MGEPELLKQRKPHLIAHRGGDLDVENSAESFKKSFQMGISFLETDVIVTKDNLVVSYHGSQNFYMKKKSGLEKRRQLQKLSYREMNKLVHGPGGKLPLLEDLLLEFPEIFFSIDAKTWEVVKPLTEVINRTNSAKRVSLTSFSLKRSLKLAQLVDADGEKATALCLYRIQAYPLRLISSPVFNFLRRKGVKILHIPYQCINKKLVKAAHNQNLLIYAWSVNDKAEIKRLLTINVDGIISDDVKLLKKSA